MFGFKRRQPRTNTAQTAKERLQILLAHDRSDQSRHDFLPLLQRDILEVVKRHMKIENDDTVDVKLERGDTMSSLEINIELPATPVRRAS